MKNIFNILIIFVQIIFFSSCKNILTKATTPTPAQQVISTVIVSHQQPELIKFDTIKHLSQPFQLNGISLYWEKIIITNEGLSDKYINLKNYKTNQLLIETPLYEDSLDNSVEYYSRLNKQCFEDYNFDGFKDLSFYERGSMAMTSVTSIYLFNLKTKTFDHSEELSATGVEIDKKNRIFIATNFNLNSETTIKYHFDKFGKIEYKESITEENYNPNDTTLKLIRTYIKIVKGKELKAKTDTIENYH